MSILKNKLQQHADTYPGQTITDRFVPDDKRAFMTSQGATYNALKDVAPTRTVMPLFGWLEMVDRDDTITEAERIVQYEILAGTIATNSLLNEAVRLSQSSTDIDRRVAEFLKHSQEIFAEIDPNLFWQTLEYKRESVARLQFTPSSLGSISQELLLGTSDIPGLLPPSEPVEKLYLPSQETVDHLHGWVEEEYADILSLTGNDTSRTFSAEDLKELYDETFIIRGMDESGWHAVLVDRPGGPLSTNPRKKRIEIPRDRGSLSWKLARQKLVHEATHAIRSFNGENSGVVAADTGMHGNSSFEESWMAILETGVSGKFNTKVVPGLNAYLAVGLAMGVDGKKRTSRELYDIFYHLTLVNKANSETDEAKLQAAAHKTALTRVQTTYRGTPGTIPGAVLTRNLLYLNEAEAIWSAIEQTPDLDGLMKWWLAGKFNPFNKTHVEAMASRGIKR